MASLFRGGGEQRIAALAEEKFCSYESDPVSTLQGVCRELTTVAVSTSEIVNVDVKLASTVASSGRLNRHVGFARPLDRFLLIQPVVCDTRLRLVRLLQRIYPDRRPGPSVLQDSATDNEIQEYVKACFEAWGVSVKNCRVVSGLNWVTFECPRGNNVVGVADYLSGPIARPEYDLNGPWNLYEELPALHDD